MLRLVCRCGPRVRVLPFPAREVVLGAGEESDLVLPFPGVSRRHARLVPLGRDLLVVDLRSRNGLVCGGERVPQALLTLGGELRLGEATLMIEEIPSADGVPALLLSAEAEPAAPARPTSAVEPAIELRSPRAALRLVRRLEGPARGDSGLAEALPILGAETLLLFRPEGGDLAVVECRGALPSEAVTRALVGEAAAETKGGLLRLPTPLGERTVLLGHLGADGARLAAVFAPPDLGPGAWERDLFDHLAGRLGALGGWPAPDAAPALLPLHLPPEMELGSSPAARALLTAIEAAARSRRDVLVSGETGAGKELVARALHASGPAAGGPFLAINCAAIPAELAEAELFGILKNVATSVDARTGLFVRASGGTLFLDEIGELAPALQAKLLRTLELREVLPVGAAAPQKVEVRVISASNRDLAKDVADGRFRADLYYRLRGMEVAVPPLRERREDVPALAAAFARRSASSHGKWIAGISRAALALLMAHDWPGNVRELATEIERAVLLCPEGGVLGAAHLDLQPASCAEGGATAAAALPAMATLEERIAALEREALLGALAASGGNKAKAARALGLTRNGLNLKLKRLGLTGARG